MAGDHENGRHQGVSPGARLRRLCGLDEIAEPGSRGFRLDDDADPRPFLVVRAGGRVAAYENVCPHAGSPLDWLPDRFLDVDRRRILCATHGALFRIADGHCIGGPCAGKALTPVPIQIADGAIYLVEETDPPA
jgi:nitrite reductase/ring-hydroxylating ferredoxin subunit